MLLPSSFYGHRKEVAARCRKMVNAWKSGAKLQDVVGELTESAERPGLIVLEDPTLVDEQPNFHMAPLLEAVRKELKGKPDAAEHEERAFGEALTTTWGTLMLIAGANVVWFGPPWQPAAHRHRPFIDAVARHWEELSAEGKRYTSGPPFPTDLWETQTNIQPVLLHLGVPGPQLGRPLPAGGIAELVATAAGARAQ